MEARGDPRRAKAPTPQPLLPRDSPSEEVWRLLLQPNPPRGAALAAATQGGISGARPLVLAAESVAMQRQNKRKLKCAGLVKRLKGIR